MIVFGTICLVLLIIVIVALFYVYNISIGAETKKADFKKLLMFIIINIFIAPVMIFIAMNLK